MARASKASTSVRLEQASADPDVGKLCTDFRRCVDQRDGDFWPRARVNYEARYCVWPNQFWDGRKWTKRGGRKPFPWPGCSDHRVPLVDKFIREDVAMLMQIWKLNRVMARPTKAARDAGFALRLTQVLRWLVYTEIEEAEDEAELLANLVLERGSAVLQVMWLREEQLATTKIRMEQIEAGAMMAQRRLASGQQGESLQLQAALPSLIADPDHEDILVSVFQAILVEQGGSGEGGGSAYGRGEKLPLALDAARIRKVIRDLRANGEASFPQAYVKTDRPCYRALAWNEDVFLPPECTDLQHSRQSFVREILSETDLVERIRTLDWDPNWVDQVIETQRGRRIFDPREHAAGRSRSGGRSEQEDRYLFEVVTAYQRLYDEDKVPGWWMTTFSAGLTSGKDNGLVARHQLCDYDHGGLPMVLFQTERRSRLADDARGYGERAFTMQQMIKRQWDARSDRADVATLPPSHHPPGEEPTAWGPGVQLPTMQPERYGYFETPPADAGSQEIEMTVRQFADEYFARPVDNQNTIQAQALQQDLVRGWFKGWRRVFTMTLQLAQQYLPDQFYYRVVGTDQGRPLRATREDIQGQFDIEIRFNTRDLDPEFVAEKVGLLEKALAMDVNGRIDRDEALTASMELIDPGYAERLLKPGEEAAQAQVADEQQALSKMLHGIVVDLKGGEAAVLRKQVLTDLITKNPTAQMIISKNKQVKEIVMRRFKQLDFQIAQKTVNPGIGRTGTKPNEQLQPPAMAPSPVQTAMEQDGGPGP